MTPAERRRVLAIMERLNEAAEEFRASREAVHTALVALIDANEAQGRSIDKVIAATGIAIELFNNEAGQ